jgi:hypothetical protein
VAVALVYGGVGGKEVKVGGTVSTKEPGARAMGEDYGEGVVVVGAVLVLKFNALGWRGVEGGGGRRGGREGESM